MRYAISVVAISLLVVAVGTPTAEAQGPEPVIDEQAINLLDDLVSDVTSGFAAVTNAITESTFTISQAISTSGSSQSMAMGKLLEAHAQEMARWQTDLKDNTDPLVTSALPPNHCYVVTAQLAWSAATSARAGASSVMAHTMNGWTLGSATSPSAGGPSAAAASLTSQHIAQAENANGGVNSTTAQDLKNRGVVVKGGDGGSAPLHPEYLVEAMTLDDSEITGNGAWTQEAIAQLWDPAPPPLPDPITASSAEVSRALARAGRIAWAEEPIREMIGNRKAGAGLQAWAQGLIQQNGNASAIQIPTNVSVKQVMDVLVNQKYGGASFTTGLANMDEVGLLMEFVSMQSVRLQLDWIEYLHDEMMGVVNGQQYAFLINKG